MELLFHPPRLLLACVPPLADIHHLAGKAPDSTSLLLLSFVVAQHCHAAVENTYTFPGSTPLRKNVSGKRGSCTSLFTTSSL